MDRSRRSSGCGSRKSVRRHFLTCQGTWPRGRDGEALRLASEESPALYGRLRRSGPGHRLDGLRVMLLPMMTMGSGWLGRGSRVLSSPALLRRRRPPGLCVERGDRAIVSRCLLKRHSQPRELVRPSCRGPAESVSGRARLVWGTVNWRDGD